MTNDFLERIYNKKILFESKDLIIIASGRLVVFKPKGEVNLENWQIGFKAGFEYWIQNFPLHYKKNKPLTFWEFLKYKLNIKTEHPYLKPLLWFNDLSDLQPITGAHYNWLIEYVKKESNKFYPPCKIAFINSDNPIASMQACLYTTWLSGFDGSDIKIFDSYQKAQEWLYADPVAKLLTNDNYCII